MRSATRAVAGVLTVLLVAATGCGELRPDDDIPRTDGGGDAGADLVDADIPRPDADDRDLGDDLDAVDTPDGADAMDCVAACVGMCGTLPNGCPCTPTCEGGRDCVDNRCVCPAGSEECGTGECVPLATTAQHCGQCGHDCGPGAMCSGSQCQPAIIVDGQRNPTALTLHEDQVFWVNNAAPPDGAVRGAPKLGVEVAPTVEIAGQNNPAAIAVDATGIYFANQVGNQVRRYSLAGAQVIDNYATAPEDRTPVAVAIDGTRIYWAAQDTGVVRYKSKMNTGTTTEVSPAESAPAALAVDADGVYWVNFGTQDVSDGTVRRRLFAGAGQETIADEETNPVAIVLQGSGPSANLVYATRTMVRRIAKDADDTTPPTTLAMGQERPVAVAVDTTHVYWVNYDSGELMRVPHDQSQEPEPVVTGLDHPAGIAVDDDYLYISASNDGGAQGAILRVRKPPR